MDPLSRRHLTLRAQFATGLADDMPPSPTAAITRALANTRSHTANNDLLFLEAWERQASPDLSALLRAAQIRRANPALAAELRAELSRGRPLTTAERLTLMIALEK